MENIQTKILIIGAGPAGLSCSLFLSKLKIEHVLIEKEKFPRDKICGDALSGKVIELLKKLNPELVKRFNDSPKQIGSWGVSFFAPNGKMLRIPFKQEKSSYNIPPGNISKRIDFDEFLYQEAKKSPYASIRENSPATEIKKTNNGYIVKTPQQSYDCNILVAADGANSKFTREFGQIEKQANHYCAGVRSYYTGVSNMDNENFIELHFLKELLPGYFWIFPLPDGQANVGLGIRSDVIKKKKLDLKTLLPQIIKNNPELSKRFQNAEQNSPVKGFGLPLGSIKRKIAGNNYLLLGDAASLIDPFTGEGIGNAMFCGMYAAETINSAIKANNYNESLLSEYQEKVYHRMWAELKLSRRMQQLVKYPFLFDFIVNKAHKNETLKETISCMFEDLQLRERLKKPSFYFNLIFNR